MNVDGTLKDRLSQAAELAINASMETLAKLSGQALHNRIALMLEDWAARNLKLAKTHAEFVEITCAEGAASDLRLARLRRNRDSWKKRCLYAETRLDEIEQRLTEILEQK